MKRGNVGSSLHLSVCIRACVLYARVCVHVCMCIYRYDVELFLGSKFGLLRCYSLVQICFEHCLSKTLLNTFQQIYGKNAQTFVVSLSAPSWPFFLKHQTWTR